MDGSSRKRLPKTSREPGAFVGRRLTDRSLTIIDIIGRYRVVPTSAIIRLAGGNEDVTHRHLQMLYHQNLVGRTTRPGTSPNAEFAYFLENSPQLRQLARNHAKNEEWFGNGVGHRKTSDNYALRQNSPGRLLFMEHELMIAEFHAAVELAALKSSGRVQLDEWRQGTTTWDRVRAQANGFAILPHRPDAYFVLRFPTAAPGQQRARFFYEADRGTTSTTRFKLKLQAYLSFFMSGQYREKYGAEKVRSVLVETSTEAREKELMTLAAELAAMEPLAGMLFWFADSAALRAASGFAAVWSTPADAHVRSLLD